MSTDEPNGLEVNSKSIGFSIVVDRMRGEVSSSVSGGMLLISGRCGVVVLGVGDSIR